MYLHTYMHAFIHPFVHSFTNLFPEFRSYQTDSRMWNKSYNTKYAELVQ